MIGVVLGLVVVCLVTAGAIAGVALVQRLVPSARRQRHNDVAGFIYAVVGVAYAVVLALVIIAVWERFSEARGTAAREASQLAEVFWLAHRMPEPDGRRVQELAHSYAEVVVEEEWPLMQEGRASPRAWAILDDIREPIQDGLVRPGAEQMLYFQALERLRDVNDARRDRLVVAREGLPAVLWVVLLAGFVIVVGFAYSFGLDDTAVHAFMIGALAAIFALALFSVATLDYPFGAGVSVGPEAFELVLGRFETSDLSDLPSAGSGH
jgi:hypothetical protein